MCCFLYNHTCQFCGSPTIFLLLAGTIRAGAGAQASCHGPHLRDFSCGRAAGLYSSERSQLSALYRHQSHVRLLAGGLDLRLFPVDVQEQGFDAVMESILMTISSKLVRACLYQLSPRSFFEDLAGYSENTRCATRRLRSYLPPAMLEQPLVLRSAHIYVCLLLPTHLQPLTMPFY